MIQAGWLDDAGRRNGVFARGQWRVASAGSVSDNETDWIVAFTFDAAAGGSLRLWQARAVQGRVESTLWTDGERRACFSRPSGLPKTRNSVEFYAGDLGRLVVERLKPTFPNIWFVGGGRLCAECLRLQLADEVRYSIVPILIGDGISFFQGLDKDVALHLREATACRNGMLALRYEVRK